MSPKSSLSESDAFRFVGDAEAKQALLDLFDKAQRVKSNKAGPVLVMLVSRRLSCLYEMLLSSGDISPFDRNGFEVVTDRVLDTCDDKAKGRWRNRRAVLIDDVVNLGSSLTDRYNELASIVGGPELVEALVGIRDKNRSSPALMDHLGIRSQDNGGPLERNEQQLKDLALDLVTCLYRNLTPYFTDFPALRKIEVGNEAFASLLATRRWMVADVTAPIADKSQRAYSFIPTKETEGLIRRKAVARAIELGEILKVRIYTKRQPDTGNVTMRIVPIGVPSGVMPKRLDRTLDAVTGELHHIGDSELRWETWKPRAKHRLLQMYLSACMATEFWVDLNTSGAECPKLDKSMLEESPTVSYFGNQQYDKVTRAFDLAVEQYRNNPGDGEPADEPFKLQPTSELWKNFKVRQHTAMLSDYMAIQGDSPSPERPEPGQVANVGEHGLWIHRVHSVFGDIDWELERPQAKALRDLPYADYYRYSNGEDIEGIGPRVLSQGIRLGELADALGLDADSEDRWQRALPSLALDIANDLGIAVPATVGDNPKRAVYRQYRSGEGAFLAGQSHVRLRGNDQDEDLDYMTRYALALPLRGRITGEADCEYAESWERERQESRDEAFSRGMLIQKWVGDVVGHSETTFTADFFSTLTDGDSVQMTFHKGDVLSEQDADLIDEGDTVEWRVYEGENPHGKIRGRNIRVAARAL